MSGIFRTYVSICNIDEKFLKLPVGANVGVDTI